MHVNMFEMRGYGQGQPQEQGQAQQQAGTFVPGAAAFVPQTVAGFGGPPADGTVGGQIQAGWFDELLPGGGSTVHGLAQPQGAFRAAGTAPQVHGGLVPHVAQSSNRQGAPAGQGHVPNRAALSTLLQQELAHANERHMSLSFLSEYTKIDLDAGKFIGIISRTGSVIVALVKLEDCVLIFTVVKLQDCFPASEIW